MNKKPINEARDPLLRGAIHALRRARKRAQREAEKTGTGLIVSEGKTGWIRISPMRKSGSKKP